MHYCVANMPGAVARSSTIALTSVTLQYGLQIAGLGLKAAAKANEPLQRGHQHLRRQVRAPRGGEELRPAVHGVHSLTVQPRPTSSRPTVTTATPMSLGGCRGSFSTMTPRAAPIGTDSCRNATT